MEDLAYICLSISSLVRVVKQFNLFCTPVIILGTELTNIAYSFSNLACVDFCFVIDAILPLTCLS